MQGLPNDYHIRQAMPEDANTLVNLWQKIDTQGGPRPFGGDTVDKPQHAKKTIQQIIKSKQARLFVYSYKDCIVATIAGHVFEKPAVQLTPVGVIYSLWVEEEHRRQGIAKHLLATLEKALKGLGAKAIQVGWDSPNHYAAQWWQNQGYQPYEVIASKDFT